MYDRETVELVLTMLASGCTITEASSASGVPRGTVGYWASGRIPHRRVEKPPRKKALITDAMWYSGEAMVAAGYKAQAIAGALGISVRTAYYLIGKVRSKPVEVRMEKPTKVDPKASPEIRELQARVRALELEKAAMEEVLAVLKAGLPCRERKLRGRERATAARALAARGFSVSEACGAVGVARSTFYYHDSRDEAPRSRADEVRDLVRELFEKGRARWGYRTIWARMRRAGVACSEKVVRRVMREEGLSVVYVKRRRKFNSYGGEISEAPPNVVNRDFRASAPNQKWLTDITEFRLSDELKCYLSPVVDCFDGKIVSWSAGTSPNAELANSSLRAAVSTLLSGESPVIHSDRGCHYRWPGWRRICEEAGLVRSMSKKGCSPDNSACEGVFGRTKNEFFYYEDWEGVGADEFISLLGDYIEYYNEGRIKRSLGWMSPNEYRRSIGYPA